MKKSTIVKQNKNIIESDQQEIKSSPWLEDYLDCFDFKLRPVTKAFLTKLAKELVQWSKNNKDALVVSDFFTEKGIPKTTYYNWIKKYENLKLAYDTALDFIASRREKGALKRELSESMVIRRQHAYDPEWKADKAQEKQDKIDVAIAIRHAINDTGEKNVTVVFSCYRDHSKELNCKCDVKDLQLTKES